MIAGAERRLTGEGAVGTPCEHGKLREGGEPSRVNGFVNHNIRGRRNAPARSMCEPEGVRRAGFYVIENLGGFHDVSSLFG